MAETLAGDYRTRQDEQNQEEEQKKVRFGDISLTAAWIGAAYLAYSPQQIRNDIRNEWIQKVTKEISKDAKFKDVFQTRKRNEDRHEYDSRRQQQNQIKSAISDLVGAHGDQLFEKGIGTTVTVRQTLGGLIDNDYQGLENSRLDLINKISTIQQELADPVKQQNDKNNARFKSKGLYPYKGNLTDLENQEKAEYHAEVISRRELKETIKQTPDSKERSAALSQTQITQKALARVLASQNLANLSEDRFLELFRAEINKELFNKRGHRRYKIDSIDDDRILRIGKYYSRYAQQIPSSGLSSGSQTSKTQPTTAPTVKTQADPVFKNWPKFSLSWPRIDLSGLNSLLKSNMSSIYRSFSGFLENLGGFMSRLPGIGSFFGGGAAATGATAVTGTTVTGAVGAAGATAGAGAAGGAATIGAAATVEVWGPILIIGTIVALLILVIILILFNNPVTKPYALQQAQITAGAPSPQLSPDSSTPYLTAGANLEEVMTLASSATCTPLAILKAISRREAVTVWNYDENQFAFYNSFPWWTSDEINEQQSADKTKVCQGFGYNTCTNEIAKDSKFSEQYCGSGPVSNLCVSGAEVMGPMQFEKGTWNGYKSRVEQNLVQNNINRQADRRIILDAFLAAGLKLNQDSGATNCTNWSAIEIENASRRYYGKCIYTIGNGGNYCREVCDYYNEYSEQTVNCNLVGL